MQNFIKLILFSLMTPEILCATWLRATGSGDTYGLINSVFGGYGTGENPDCSHESFGKHIREGNDGQLSRQVFFFHSHVNEDNDRCQNFDRQRNEIRPDEGHLTAGSGETQSFSWIFKLPEGFQPSNSFTHIHQLKAVGGDDGQPLITFTPRYNSGGNKMELIHISSGGTTTKVETVNLAPFLGVWVKVNQQVTYGTNGKYSVNMSLLSNGQTLLSYTNNNIDLWRSGADYIRAKWGIYRSLSDSGKLQDEIVRFNDFCIAKGSDTCP